VARGPVAGAAGDGGVAARGSGGPDRPLVAGALAADARRGYRVGGRARERRELGPRAAVLPAGLGASPTARHLAEHVHRQRPVRERDELPVPAGAGPHRPAHAAGGRLRDRPHSRHQPAGPGGRPASGARRRSAGARRVATAAGGHTRQARRRGGRAGAPHGALLPGHAAGSGPPVPRPRCGRLLGRARVGAPLLLCGRGRVALAGERDAHRPLSDRPRAAEGGGREDALRPAGAGSASRAGPAEQPAGRVRRRQRGRAGATGARGLFAARSPT
jgi:hypothetical protein